MFKLKEQIVFYFLLIHYVPDTQYTPSLSVVVHNFEAAMFEIMCSIDRSTIN